MKVYDAANIRNVALVGHSASGKTQLASAALFDAGTVNRFGKVDEGTTITEGGGPDLVFHALFPKPGNYRIWLQFQRNNVLSTIPFTVRVFRPGEATAAQ